jgi:hypothetical protein
VVGDSTYHGLELHADRRFSRGCCYRFPICIRDAGDLKAEHALATLDERNRFVANLLYELPVGPGKSINVPNRFLNALAGGWQVNCTFADHSGQPFTPELSFNPANTDAGDARPNRIANGNPPSGERTVQHWFDTAAFVPGPAYLFGNAGRNILIGLGAVDTDFSVFKSFGLPGFGEQSTLQFRAEFFNLFNHPQFALPNATVNIPQGGSITSTNNPMRQIQFALKLIF